MRIVKMEELKKMPDGTVFRPVGEGPFGGFADDQVQVISRMYPQENGFNGIEYLLPNMDWDLLKSGDKWDNNDPTKCDYPVDPDRCVIDTTDWEIEEKGTQYFSVFDEKEIIHRIEILSSALGEVRKNSQTVDTKQKTE